MALGISADHQDDFLEHLKSQTLHRCDESKFGRHSAPRFSHFLCTPTHLEKGHCSLLETEHHISGEPWRQDSLFWPGFRRNFVRREAFTASPRTNSSHSKIGTNGSPLPLGVLMSRPEMVHPYHLRRLFPLLRCATADTEAEMGTISERARNRRRKYHLPFYLSLHAPECFAFCPPPSAFKSWFVKWLS